MEKWNKWEIYLDGGLKTSNERIYSPINRALDFAYFKIVWLEQLKCLAAALEEGKV